MAERLRNPDWENDEALRSDLEKYVRQNLRRNEILDFIKLEYPMYAWSLRSLGRRLQFFNIKYADYEVNLAEVKRAVEKELQGPGKLLGYRGCLDVIGRHFIAHNTFFAPLSSLTNRTCRVFQLLI